MPAFLRRVRHRGPFAPRLPRLALHHPQPRPPAAPPAGAMPSLSLAGVSHRQHSLRCQATDDHRLLPRHSPAHPSPTRCFSPRVGTSTRKEPALGLESQAQPIAGQARTPQTGGPERFRATGRQPFGRRAVRHRLRHSRQEVVWHGQAWVVAPVPAADAAELRAGSPRADNQGLASFRGITEAACSSRPTVSEGGRCGQTRNAKTCLGQSDAQQTPAIAGRDIPRYFAHFRYRFHCRFDLLSPALRSFYADVRTLPLLYRPLTSPESRCDQE